MNATLEAPSTRTAQESVLFVCTANLARSPLAAVLLAAQLRAAGRTDIRVASAGVQAEHGADRLDEVQEIANECGLDLGAHEPRQLGAELLEDATLVITMTESQRATATRLLPTAVSRTFTFIELVRLLDVSDESIETLAGMAAAAHRARAYTQAVSESEDVVDPVGQPRSQYENTVIQLDQLAQGISSRLPTEGVGRHRADG